MVGVCENLRGFASTRPPIVIFTVCLTLFAAVLLMSAYYVKVHDIPNPDASQDWNAFLKNFADLEFCLGGNLDNVAIEPAAAATKSAAAEAVALAAKSLAAGSVAAGSVAPHPPSRIAVMEATTFISDNDALRNYSTSLLLSIQPTLEFLNIHHNITHISGSLKGSDLGIVGPGEDEMINITADLPWEWNSTKCCDVVQIYACVHFTAPSHVFPASRSPPLCENINETGTEYHARLRVQKPQPQVHTLFCQSLPSIKVKYNFNPSLAVWLSMHDKSLINLHLMHTSYFLFVMVVTLLCYAVFRGRLPGIPGKNKVTQLEAKLLPESNSV